MNNLMVLAFFDIRAHQILIRNLRLTAQLNPPLLAITLQTLSHNSFFKSSKVVSLTNPSNDTLFPFKPFFKTPTFGFFTIRDVCCSLLATKKLKTKKISKIKQKSKKNCESIRKDARNGPII